MSARTLLPLLLFAVAASAAPERSILEDRIRWLEGLLAKERARLAELDARELAAERKRVGHNPGPIESTGVAVTAKTPLAPGKELQVQWGGRWWAARVVALEGDRVRIHYLGWDHRWDETVKRERLQRDDGAAAKARASKTVPLLPPILPLPPLRG